MNLFSFLEELLRAAKARLQLDEDPGETATARARGLVELCEEKAREINQLDH